jgi:Protein of unknown function (DUF3078)
MKKLCLFVVFGTMIGYAQQDTAKAPEYGWKHSVVAGLTLTQVSFTDWAQGGDNALGYAASIDGKSAQDLEKTNWTTAYKFAFGQTRLGDQGLRKTDDKIDLETILTYKVGEYVNPYGAATLKSQFAKGYMYDGANNETAVSRFFDPAYLTQSVGVGYQPIPEVKTRLGVGVREILTSEFTAYSDDPATPQIETSKVDGGLESVTELEWKLDDNILFKSKLELFGPFKTLDRIVVRNDNSLVSKVSRYISVVLNVQLVNEPDISPKTQVKETLALGLSYTLL